jgi:HPr kinase/phosphorylase
MDRAWDCLSSGSVVMGNGMECTTIRGVLVSVLGLGVLIRGASGAGKSYTALALMRRGHFLIADELVEVAAGADGRPVGRGREANVRTEVRGLGIFDAESLFPGATARSWPIDFVVELDRYDDSRDSGRTTPQTGETCILDSRLLTVRVPLPNGVDPGLVIELLARLYKQTGSVIP